MSSVASAPATPKWLSRVVWATLAVSLVLLFCEAVLLGQGWRRDYLTKFIMFPLFWLSGAVALLGIIGAVVTKRFRWLWLLPGGGAIAIATFSLVMARFNWGM